MQLIKELIDRVELFEQENKATPIDLKNFAAWLHSAVFNSEDESKLVHDESEMEYSFLMIMQYRQFKSRARVALEASMLNSFDEYSFLFHLCYTDSFRKMELIRIHLLEPASGIEVLRRLLKKGLITEFDDPDDGRAKRVKITDNGRNQVDLCSGPIQKVYSDMLAHSSPSDSLQLVSLLKKLK